MWSVLVPILVEAGAPVLKKIIAKELPGAETLAGPVIDILASKLGVDSTPDAIADAYKANPADAAVVIKEVEQTFSAAWAERAIEGRDALLTREDERASWFSWAWRPAMSWLLIWLWVWNTTLMPLLNAALRATLPPVPYEHLIAFCGVWLVIYGGGHTVKSVFGK